AAHAALAQRDPAAAAAVHPNDRRRVVRALELADAGASLRPDRDRLWSGATRHPTLIVGLQVPREELLRRIEERTRAMLRGGDADGILEVLSVEADAAEIVIWNPDGSQAELSGNGTRIAARWLADRNGAGRVRIRVGGRVVAAEMLRDGRVEQELGEFSVGQ